MDMKEIYNKMVDKAGKDDAFRSELLSKQKEALNSRRISILQNRTAEISHRI